ncbi:MAG: mandelate racemase/muconate lactonizing enzyme family protein [Gemmatimonadota bacterium]
MRIADVRAHVMGVPGPDGHTPRRNWIFVEVITDAGLTGLGEATTEYCEMAVAAQIETELRPRLLGLDPTDIERVWQLGFRDFWWRRGVVQTSALSGVDQALWDLAGKAAGLPVFRLLGGRVREQVRCYARADLGLGSIEAHAAQALAEGFDAFKHGYGAEVVPFDEDRQVEVAIEELTRYRRALGAGVDLMIDCAGLFSPAAAHRLVAGLGPLDLLFVEEPMEQGTVEPYVRLKRDFPSVRLAAGERWMTRWDCREWFERQAVDVCQVDVCHTGGISELMKIAHFAEVYGIQVAPHNPYGPVALAAGAHAVAAMQNFALLEHCRLRPWFDQVQTVAVPLRQGHVDVEELGRRPGLGVELDFDLVRAHPFRALPAGRHVAADGSTHLY